MKMLRWAGGVTLAVISPNKYIRGCLKICPVEDKLSEEHLRYGMAM